MNYPIPSIIFGAIAAYLVSTFVGTLISKFDFPLPSTNNRIGCIDGLRGYLALSVLIHHFIIWTQVTKLEGIWEDPTVPLFSHLGSGGVTLFFMTTGFVFYPRVLVGFKNSSWIAVYIGRVFRIIPLVLFSVIVITGIIYLRTHQGFDASYPIAALKWVSALSEPPLLNYQDSGRLNAYVLWSLRSEWFFYFTVLPVCALAIDFARRRIPSFMIPLGLLVGTMAARYFEVQFLVIRYLPLFALGMIAYEIHKNKYLAEILRKPAATITATSALLTGMLGPYQPFDYAAPLFALFFTCVACGNDIFGLLRTRGALVLGECSYGIYILHGTVLFLFFENGRGMINYIPANILPATIPLIACITTALTAITYISIERPAIRWGRWLIKYWTGRKMRADSPQLEVAP